MSAHHRPASAPSLRTLKKLLRTLAQSGTMLVQDRNDERACYRLTGGRKNAMVPAGLITWCAREDLLALREGGFVLSENGRMTLRRLLAGADPFSAQHQDRKSATRRVDGENRSVLINDRSTPLGWLAGRKDAGGKPLISPRQFEAGERLARDFQFAGMRPRLTASWSIEGGRGKRRSNPGDGLDVSDNALAARQRLQKALDEVGGELAELLLDICCFQNKLSAIEKARNWPQRSAKIILQIALERLCAHYGMSAGQQQQELSGRISHWGDDNYRPRI